MPAVIGLPGYTYAAPLKIPWQNVAGNLSNFQLLPPMDLPADIAAKMAFEDCRDLRFTLADGTLLYHELVSASRSAQLLQAWVRVPSVLSSSDTTIWGQCGNAAATMPSAAEQQATWDGHVDVRHLEETATGQGGAGLYRNSVTGLADGTDYVSATGKTGVIGAGQQFDGADDYIGIGVVAPGAAFSLSAWVQAANGKDQAIIASTSASLTSYTLRWNSTNNVQFAWYAGRIGGVRTTAAYNPTSWTLVRATRASSGVCAIYINGAPADTVPVGYTPLPPQTEPTSIGRNGAVEQFPLDGYVDEARIASFAPSAAYALTEHANQSNPAAFSTWGPVESLASYVPHRRPILYRSGPTLRGVI